MKETKKMVFTKMDCHGNKVPMSTDETAEKIRADKKLAAILFPGTLTEGIYKEAIS